MRKRGVYGQLHRVFGWRISASADKELCGSRSSLGVPRIGQTRAFQRMFSERNPMVWGSVKPEDDELETVVLYQASAEKIAQRLDIMGFSLRRAEQDFESLRRERIKEIQPDEDDLEDVWAGESRTEIERLTFADYASNLRSVMQRKSCVRSRSKIEMGRMSVAPSATSSITTRTISWAISARTRDS